MSGGFRAALAALLVAFPLAAQDAPIRLSLEDAVGAALERSEEVGTARAALAGSQAQVRSARSAALPQIGTQLAYTKALRSVFQGAGFELPDSLKFEPNPNLPLDQRVAYLEDRTPDAALGALGGLFGNLPFGNENTWVAGLSVSQPLFAGGRIASAIDLAEAGEDASRAQLEEASADVALETRVAYLDAALAAATVEIVSASVALAQEHLDQVKLRLEVGRVSELEALRAEVELENLRPQLVQAENGRAVALLNLKRLVNLPADAELVLTTPLEPEDGGAALRSVTLPTAAEAEGLLARRAAVRAAEARVKANEEQLDIARAAFLPSVALQGNLTRQAFPSGGFGFPASSDWRDDWSVGFSVQWPLFQGLRRDADVDFARAGLRQAELGRAQLEEAVRLEYERAHGELERTRAQIVAASRTVEQAERVYELTEMRFAEGLATQLDVAQARLSLQQARVNEASAFHGARVALARAERALGTAVRP